VLASGKCLLLPVDGLMQLIEQDETGWNWHIKVMINERTDAASTKMNEAMMPPKFFNTFKVNFKMVLGTPGAKSKPASSCSTSQILQDIFDDEEDEQDSFS